MEFLVEFEIKIPDGTPESEIHEREGSEAIAATELVRAGKLVRVWKLADPRGNGTVLGLYRAGSRRELDELLAGLPLCEWMRIGVTPLARHLNDPAAAQ